METKFEMAEKMFESGGGSVFHIALSFEITTTMNMLLTNCSFSVMPLKRSRMFQVWKRLNTEWQKYAVLVPQYAGSQHGKRLNSYNINTFNLQQRNKPRGSEARF